MKPITALEEIKGGNIKKYRKKPVVIRAVEIPEKIEIMTREGKLYGYKGDMLIEGVEGEIYPCGKDIFQKTYEEA